MRKIFEFSIRQPLFVNLLTLMVFVAGILAIINLNRDTFPNVTLDIVAVSTTYPGATPQEVEKLITIPIEKELKEVDDIKEMASASIEGRSDIIIEIEPDAPDKNKVVNDIQRAVDKAEDLPDDLKEEPLVTDIEMRDHPVVEVSLSGDFTEHELIKHARVIERMLLDLPGIAKVVRNGWREEEIWVEVDPEKVNSYQLSLSDVVTALKAQNVSIPGGSVIIGSKESLIRTTGEFETPPEVEEVVLRANELGHWVQVKDVAKVSNNFEPYTTIHHTDGKRAINLIAVKKESSDVITLVDQIKNVADEYKKIGPPNLNISIVNDFSYYVKRRLNVLVNNGWIGITLVVICLFLFLSARAAFVTAIGIPTAFLITFSVMYYSGITINLLTMFGLIMVLGMLVDDAIIITENVHRRIAGGEKAADAAINGTDEIWRPVLTTVLTTIAAFAPLMFMSGIIGKFVLYIPLVVIIALMSSLLQAFIILPSHIVMIERLPHHPKFARFHTGLMGRTFARFTDRYVALLKKIIRHRWLTVSAALTFIMISLYIGIFHLPMVLFPQRGIDAFYVRAKAPIGTPVEQMEKLMERLEGEVEKLPKSEVDNIITYVGVVQQDANDPYSERASHEGQILVLLKPQADREMTSDELINILRKSTKGFNEFTEISFDNVRPGPPVGKPVVVRVRGDDLPELDSIADEIKGYLATIKGVSDIRDDFERGKDEIRVKVNERQASRADLGVRDVALSTRSAFEGAIATTIKHADEEIDVRVRYPDEWRYRTGALDKVLIPNGRGNLVPITAIASFETTQGINAIRHFDRKRAVTVTANVDEVNATSISVTKAVAKQFKDLPRQHPGVSLDFGGEWEKTEESFRDLKMAMVVAAFIIMIILVFEFQSLLQPLIVLIAVPYGFVGVIWAFLIHFEPKSFLAMMGVVGLAGVVVNNSIVFIDFVNKAKAQGHELKDALVEAARLRLRPIFITTITTVFGLLPVAYGFMGSDPFLKPMALAIGWGLTFATCCTLLVTPALYAVVDDMHRFLFSKLVIWNSGCKKGDHST
ncbi:MAG: efflux RND transporter permease subunit [Pseudomonadota bacterium]